MAHTKLCIELALSSDIDTIDPHAEGQCTNGEAVHSDSVKHNTVWLFYETYVDPESRLAAQRTQAEPFDMKRHCPPSLDIKEVGWSAHEGHVEGQGEPAVLHSLTIFACNIK